MNQSSEGIQKLPLHDLVHIDLCRNLRRNCPMDEQDCRKCGRWRATAEKYRSTYLDVLNDLVQKCPETLKEVNTLKQSPFLFHCHTRSANDVCREWGRLELTTSPGSAKPLVENEANVTLPAQDLPTANDLQSLGSANPNTNPLRP